MSKILIIPKTIEEINLTRDVVDGFIVGIEGLSVNFNLNISIDSLKEIIEVINNKELFISINKNIDNKELFKLKSTLIQLNDYNIKGVLFYDASVLSIYNKLNLNYELVCAQEHLNTNYHTVNYWYKLNAKYTYLSSDITEKEIIDIKNNTKAIIMVNFFGYLPMFVSKRRIIKNYLEYFNLKDNSTINYIEKEDKIYPIIDNAYGTYVYSGNILNGIESYLNVNVNYAVLNSFNIDSNLFFDVIKLFNSVNKNNVKLYKEKIDNMFFNANQGFLNMETIYRVKKNEEKA